jgi:hypothetical protein
MQIRSRFWLYAGIFMFFVLPGAPGLAADCVSATFADEVYYSCSGVLTVVPRGAKPDAGKDRPSESSTPDTESAATGAAESDSEASPATP